MQSDSLSAPHPLSLDEKAATAGSSGSTYNCYLTTMVFAYLYFFKLGDL